MPEEPLVLSDRAIEVIRGRIRGMDQNQRRQLENLMGLISPAGASISIAAPTDGQETTGHIALFTYWTMILHGATNPEGSTASEHTVWSRYRSAILTSEIEGEVERWANFWWNQAPFARRHGTQPVTELIEYTDQSSVANAWTNEDSKAVLNIIAGNTQQAQAGINYLVNGGPQGRPRLGGILADAISDPPVGPDHLRNHNQMVREWEGNVADPGNVSPRRPTRDRDDPFEAEPPGWVPGEPSRPGDSPPPQDGDIPGENADDEERVAARSELAEVLRALAKWGPYVSPILKVILAFVIEIIYIIVRDRNSLIPKDDAISKMYAMIDVSTSLRTRNVRPQTVFTRWREYWARTRRAR